MYLGQGGIDGICDLDPALPSPLYEAFETDDEEEASSGWRLWSLVASRASSEARQTPHRDTFRLPFSKVVLKRICRVGLGLVLTYAMGRRVFDFSLIRHSVSENLLAVWMFVGSLSLAANSTQAPSVKTGGQQMSHNIHDGERQSTSVVKIHLIADGDGKTFPKDGDVVFVHYTGILADGTVFDTSRKRGRTVRFGFNNDRDQFIRGWSQGIGQMSLGERAMLHVPSVLAYGGTSHGLHGEIPPDSDLDFDVQILAINTEVWDRLRVTSVILGGDGAHYPKAGDVVYIYFRGFLWQEPHEQIANFTTVGQPFRFVVGLGQVDDGMDFGVQKLSLGEHATIVVPCEFGFGLQGAANGRIPGNANLTYDIELVAMEPRNFACFDDCPPPPSAGRAAVPPGALRAASARL